MRARRDADAVCEQGSAHVPLLAELGRRGRKFCRRLPQVLLTPCYLVYWRAAGRIFMVNFEVSIVQLLFAALSGLPRILDLFAPMSVDHFEEDAYELSRIDGTVA